MKRRENSGLCAFDIRIDEGENYMANAVAVRDYGDQYQALVFWKYALDLLKKDSDIKEIGYEYDEIKSFDDIVIFYKEEQNFRDTTINKAYIQVKFHMKQNEEFTIDNLLDPSFIDAKKESFLLKAVNAYRKNKEEYLKSIYVIYSTWTIRHTDTLNKLINNTDNTFDLKKICDGSTERSEMGCLRKKMCEKLSVSEDELLAVLRQIKIKSNQLDLEDLKEDLNARLTVYGLKVWSNSKDTFPYCDLIHSLNRRGINLLDKDKLRGILENEELFEQQKSNDTIAIKSFVRQTEWLDNWTENICDLMCGLDKRNLKEGYSWEDVFQMLEKFVSEKMKKDIEYQIALVTSLSISFTVGRILNPKAGIKVVPIQNTLEGRSEWDRKENSQQDQKKFLVKKDILNVDAKDVAISIGITHNIDEDVREFISDSKLQIGVYENFLLENYGTDAIKDGAHAWALAKQINNEIEKRKGKLKKGTLHIFIAGPNSVMFYLGMQSMMYGKVQLYEYDGALMQENGGLYYPTISFPQRGEF